MSEHSAASTSGSSSSLRSSAETLTRQAGEKASQAGEYAARTFQEYPFGALLLAGLIGYGLGYLFHAGWSSGTRKPLAQSYPSVIRPPGYVE